MSTLPQGLRPDWDDYFLALTVAVATRADCTRARHGAIVVSPDHRIVSTGYNGAPSGHLGCLTSGGCPRGRLSTDELAHLAGGYDDPNSPGFCISVHAEANALLHAGLDRTRQATLYVTGEPCYGCRKLIAAAGIARVVWPGC